MERTVWALGGGAGVACAQESQVAAAPGAGWFPGQCALVFRQRTAAVRASVGLGSHCCSPPEGYIKNTEKLKYGKEHQYKLTVTAYDCGKKRAAEDVLVKISIKPTCTPGWQGELHSHLCACPCSQNPSGTAT